MERTIAYMFLHFLVSFMLVKTELNKNWLFPFIIMALTIASRVIDISSSIREKASRPVVGPAFIRI